ncbi:MAG: hypothetical protein HYS44_03810 [Candidatus Niyogibacteria bacterium]|nr:hypothetical protein [Candidatus Niyogibacteria bacterium]
MKPVIGIVGLGMVGEPLRRYFEGRGFKRGRDLLCFDSDPKKSYADGVDRSDILFVCVPTPQRPDGSCDTSIIESIVRQYASPKRIIVVKSTVEPSTCERLSKKYRCPIVFNPEFLREASAWEDMQKPDRQIAAHTAGAETHAHRVLSLLPAAPLISPVKLQLPNEAITASEAELGKYAANVFGAFKVVFGNIVADLCHAVEFSLKKEKMPVAVSYEQVRRVFASDRRIGDAWLDVSRGNYRGYGGYCFPKDVNALIAFAKRLRRALPARSRERAVLASGLNVLNAVRNYNRTLLKSQGLTEETVSRHDAELEKRLKIRRQKRNERR